jgi:hypothetical protein
VRRSRRGAGTARNQAMEYAGPSYFENLYRYVVDLTQSTHCANTFEIRDPRCRRMKREAKLTMHVPEGCSRYPAILDAQFRRDQITVKSPPPIRKIQSIVF